MNDISNESSCINNEKVWSETESLNEYNSHNYSGEDPFKCLHVLVEAAMVVRQREMEAGV